MYIKQITDAAFFSKRCHILNQWVEIRGIEILILALVEDREQTQLWYMVRNSDYEPDGNENTKWRAGYEPKTQREHLVYSIQAGSHETDFQINKLTLGTIELAVDGPSGSSCFDENVANMMAMQFFCQNGMDLSRWNEVDGRNIMLFNAPVVETNGSDIFEALENTTFEDIIVDINPIVTQILLPVPLRITIGIGEKKTVTYTDPTSGELKQIYLNGVTVNDIWASLEEPAINAAATELSENDFARWKSGFEESISSICPKGQVLAMLEYDEESSFKLEFYDTTYLESPYIPQSCAVAWFFGSDQITIGPSGNPYKLAKIRSMELGEKGPFKVELISVYQVTPEERFRFLV